MNKEEMKLKVHYELRNHVGAMAMRNNSLSDYYRKFYKRIRKDQTRRYLDTIEKEWNKKLNTQGYLSLTDVYEALGFDVSYRQYMINQGLLADVGWLKEV